jgi:lysophospholipase L1-like esterase
MKFFKTLLLNFLILLVAFLSIELFFGYWFDKDNLGPYMREHRMKKNQYTLKYNNQNYNFIYKRNYYGFRGEEVNLEDIKVVIIGGSTTDERYKPMGQTITGYLNKKISKNKKKYKIINAGIEGQSTLGHIYNFEVWFPKLKKFKPKFFIFYIGINDQILNNQKSQSQDGHILNPSKIEILKDTFKSKSIFYDLIRKTKHKFYTKKNRVIYDFDYSVNKQKKNIFLNYKEALNNFEIDELKDENKNLIKNYLKNVDKLVDYSSRINATPIFINQLASEGNSNKKLFILNYSLIDHCKFKNYNCIDLAKKLKGQKEFWWDGIHTTPAGSKAIADIIFPELINFLD